MSQSFDSSRSRTALEQDNTIIAVIEMSKAKWLVAALVPGSQTPAAQEARCRCASTVEAVAALARRSRPGRASDQAHRRRL